jgi:pyruvate carboxylase
MLTNETNPTDISPPAPVIDRFVSKSLSQTCPFKKVLAANRGEIAVRICRAATELNLPTATIYAYEDRNSAHRWDSDESFLLPTSGTPVGAYLNITNIINIAKEVRFILSSKH